MKTKHDYEKPVLIKNVFEIFTYQKTKTHAKHDSWLNRIILLKTSILSVFEQVTFKNDKIHAK